MVVPDVATKILGVVDRAIFSSLPELFARNGKTSVTGKTAVWTTFSKNGVIPLHHALIQEEFELCEKILKQIKF